MKPIPLCAVALICLLHPALAAPVISEFLASNPSGQLDQDKETSDWIEIHNPGPDTVNLGGYHLSTDPDQPKQWPLLALDLKPGDYLLVFASGKDRRTGSELHTNFSLDVAGEYLALTDPSGKAVSAFDPYPPQRAGISYGLRPGTAEYALFKTATPGAVNGSGGLAGFVADTKFSVDRGFYDTPFEVVISCETPGAKILYSLNGQDPVAGLGQEYTGPIRVESTTVLRARATKDGWESSNADTQTYLFTAAVASQTSASLQARGFPAKWKTQAVDYEVDPDVVGPNDKFNGQYRDTFKDDLKVGPSLSIVMKMEDMFGTQGIYSNPGSRGRAWERATSIELLYPDGAKPNHQVDAGIRIQGGAFRDFGLTRKKSFRVVFKEEYGPGKLRFPLFDDPTAAQEFNTFTLRAENNDGWQWSGANNWPQYARDQFGRDCHRAMGQPASHGFHLHVYINGAYWGIYNIVERPDSSFAESYLGVEEKDWDGQKYDGSINIGGDSARNARSRANWTKLVTLSRDVKNQTDEKAKWAAFMKMQGLYPDGTDDLNEPSYLDLTNCLDYSLLNHYLGNADWPHRNYYCGRDSSPQSEGFKFFMWDAEWTILLNSNVSSGIVTNNSGVQAPFVNLKDYEHFRVYMSDRLHKHVLRPGGALYVDPTNPTWDPAHPERNVPGALYWRLTERIKRPLVGESARWGDQHRTTNPYTVNKEWAGERTRVMNTWFSKRSTQFVQNYKTVKLYPTGIDAPRITPAPGDVDAGTQVQLSLPSTGQIYYTTDGTDPYWVNPETGKAQANAKAHVYADPIVIERTTTVKARIFQQTDSGTVQWSPLQDSTYTLGTRKLVISQIMYHPLPPTEAETKAGYGTSDFEYLEVLNAGTARVDLANVSITEGVHFTFTDQQLAPGERLRVVADLAAYGTRYGTAIRVAGAFQGTLRNEGERLHLVDASGETIRDFLYGDKIPWPEDADGTGAALVLKEANALPDHAEAGNWEAKKPEPAAPTGAFEKWLATHGLATALDDPDGDRLPAILEYALGTSPSTPSLADMPRARVTSLAINGQTASYLVFETKAALQAEGVSLRIETSADLKTWAASDLIEHTKADASWVTYRSRQPLAGGQAFFRLKASAP